MVPGAAPAAPSAAPPAPAAAATPPHPAIARITVPERDGVSYGSGTLIDARGKFGLVITNWHVVRDASGPITVEFPEGHKSPAEVIRTDKDWDLAALSILRPKAEPLIVTDQAPQIGEWLSIAGYGSGDYRAAAGYVRAYNSPSADLPAEFIELSAEARHGDSGGPIINQRGELCGVLFGSAPGYTCGAYGGRVRQFLTTVVPGGEPGSDTAASTAAIALQPPPATGGAGQPVPGAAYLAQTEIGPPRNYVPAQPQTTALHQSPAPQPYVSQSAIKDDFTHLTPAQPPGASEVPIRDWPQTPDIDARVSVERPSSAPLAAASALDVDLAPASRVHVPVPPRNGDPAAAPRVTEADSGQLLAAIWRKYGGTSFFDQAKSVLAIFGALAIAVQLWRFNGRREREYEE
jgi:serine protease Do